MTVYKMVRKEDDRYFSSERTDLRLEYFVDQFVYPEIPNSLIFVFCDKFAALEHFKFSHVNCELWEGETQSEPIAIFLRGSIGLSLSQAKIFWSGNPKGYDTFTAPDGTYGVYDLKLIRKIKDNK